MPRKLRAEYPGAMQHVINRGNYRQPIFAEGGAMHAFESCLFEACEKSNWVLHSFITMGNHYHLGLETPEGNLVSGMQWLQSTFANRFNRFRKEHGHVFQGRYKSILTEKGKSLGEVCDYIHLNPVKAQLLTVASLQEYRHSSYWYLWHPQKRPRFLRPQTALECAGGMADNPYGWQTYADDLERIAMMHNCKASWKKYERAYCRGWAIGSAEFKAKLVEDLKLDGALRSWDPTGIKAVRILRWESQLSRAIRALEREGDDPFRQPKSEPWKLTVAAWMKTKTQATNAWLSAKLNLGTPTGLSHNLTIYRRSSRVGDVDWMKLIALNEA